MPADPITTAPTITTIGSDHEPTDAAISALARLLLSLADAEITPTHNTPPPAASVECVFQSAANNGVDDEDL